MPIRPELRGGTLPYMSMAAAAIVALTVDSAHKQTPNNAHYTSETRHILELDSPYRVGHHTQTHNKHRHLTPAQIAAKEVTPAEFAAWSKVNVCEEGGKWHISGSEYSGGLGISNVNWFKYGGEFFSPAEANATPDEQIVVAMRIQKNPPDQHGCDPRGW